MNSLNENSYYHILKFAFSKTIRMKGKKKLKLIIIFLFIKYTSKYTKLFELLCVCMFICIWIRMDRKTELFVKPNTAF